MPRLCLHVSVCPTCFFPSHRALISEPIGTPFGRHCHPELCAAASPERWVLATAKVVLTHFDRLPTGRTFSEYQAPQSFPIMGPFSAQRFLLFAPRSLLPTVQLFFRRTRRSSGCTALPDSCTNRPMCGRRPHIAAAHSPKKPGVRRIRHGNLGDMRMFAKVGRQAELMR